MIRAAAAATALLALLALTGPTAVAQTSDPPKVIVLVVDGLLPEEVGPTTPTLQALKDAGTWFEESRSIMVAETIPNHVAMMTGVYAERSNIAVNAFWDRDETKPEGRDLSDPAELTADTLFTTLDRACPDLATASILSKTYLYEIFRSGGQNVQADEHWEPGPIIPKSGHTPDVNTMSQALPAVADHDFTFINLGDVDRSGHVDVTGSLFEVPADLGIPGLLPTPNNAAVRQAVLRFTDTLIGQMVDQLTQAGQWDDTVLFVVSDHGMDWSDPLGFVEVQPILDALEPGRFLVVLNGGADTVYLRNPGQPDDDADLAAARAAILAALPAEVAHAWYRQPNPADPGPDTVVPAQFHLDTRNAGEMTLVANDGWRFAGDADETKLVPGNHGHLVTRHNTFLVTGGHPSLADPQSIASPVADPDHLENFDDQSENVDVAPTVAALFGLPTDGYQGRVLSEAFRTDAPLVDCAAATAGPTGAPSTTTGAATPTTSTGGGASLPATGSSSGGWPLALGGAVVLAAAITRRMAR